MEEAELLELAKKASRAALDAGAGHADSITQNSRGVSIEIEKNSVRTGDVTYDAGYCVRAFYKGGVGFARGNGIDEKKVIGSGALAAAMARECEPDPEFRDLPHPAPYSEVGGLFDQRVEDFPPSRAVEIGIKCIETAREIAPDVITKGAFQAGSSVTAIANSNGVAVTDRSSFVSFYVFSVIRKGDKVGSYYEYSHARRLEDLKTPEEVATEATRRALSFLDSRKMESGYYPVVLGPLAAAGFLGSVIGASRAEEVQRGRSYLAGKRGEKIAPDIITIEENPFTAAGLHSSPADGEGVPRSRRALIDSGRLAIYLHNSYTAGKAGEESTGHAARDSYTSAVGISTTNLVIRPGAIPEAELIRNIKDGLYIFMGSISPHGVTGHVSGTVDFGFRILNGELAYPVENVMIGGDVFGLLSGIEAVSSDYREEAGNIMPSLLLGKVQVASA